MTSVLAMGGYGAYVWSAFAVFFIVLSIDTLLPLARRRRNLRMVRKRLARLDRRRRPGTASPHESHP